MINKNLVLLLSLVGLTVSQQSVAEQWIFVPSKENVCHIQVFYDQDALKNNQLREKYDYAKAADCDPKIRQHKTLIVENQLNCQTQQLLENAKTYYYKNGKVSKINTHNKSAYSPQGTSALLMNAACISKLKK